MLLPTAINLIHPAIPAMAGASQSWADIGAGTGLFSQALDQLLPEQSTIHALDKSPHALWYLRLERCKLVVTEGDFERDMDLPKDLDGILMANALHYAPDPLGVLRNLRHYLQPAGRLVLVEYDTDQAMPPWVPCPVSFSRLGEIAREAGWSNSERVGEMPSAYGHSRIYVAVLE